MSAVNCTYTVRQLNLEKSLQNLHYIRRDGGFIRFKTWNKTGFSLQAVLESKPCNYRCCRWCKAEGAIYFLVADQKYSQIKKKKKKLLICFTLRSLSSAFCGCLEMDRFLENRLQVQGPNSLLAHVHQH